MQHLHTKPQAQPTRSTTQPNAVMQRQAPQLQQTVLQMQRIHGNAATQRMMTQQGIQRAPTATAEEKAQKEEAEERALAQHVLTEIQERGGLNLALYLMNPSSQSTAPVEPNRAAFPNDEQYKAALATYEAQKKAYAEYKNNLEFVYQADQYASDHMSLGVKGGKLKKGMSIGIDENVTTEIKTVVDAADALLTKYPDLYESKPTVQVSNLSLFTHGDLQVLQAGANKNWMGPKNFSQGLAAHLSPTPTVNLFACLTAGTVKQAGGKNFATDLQERVTKDLQEKHGDSAEAKVWGHTTAAHTVYNTALVGVGGGGNFQEALGTRLVELVEGELEGGGITDAHRTTLEAEATKAIAATFSSVARSGDAGYKAGVKNQKYYNLSTDAQLVYFREIPVIGMDRVWNDLNDEADPTDYAEVGMSDKATARMKEGIKFFRARYKTQLAAFKKSFMTLTGKKALPDSPPRDKSKLIDI